MPPRRRPRYWASDPDRIKDSAYTITIDPRLSSNTDEEANENARRLDAALAELLGGDGAELARVVRMNIPEHTFSSPHIEEISSRYSVERGEQLRHVHAHVILHIRHRSNITLDFNKVREYIMEQLGVEKPYIQVKLRNAQRLEEYIAKDRDYTGALITRRV